MTRGNWGGGNSHGDTERFLSLFRYMGALYDGQNPKPNPRLKIEQHPEWFEGTSLSREGREVVEKLRKVIPCIWS